MSMTTWDEAVEQFDEFLDEITGEVDILGMTFLPSRILKEMDPIAYRTSLFDYIDGEGINSDDLEGELDV